MNFPYLVGVLTGWLAFTKEGRAFGDKAAKKASVYLKGFLENKNEK